MLAMQEDLDAAQHTPLYPRAGRIGYVPDFELHQDRVQSSLEHFQTSGDVSTLPKGWPLAVRGRMVWSGQDLQASETWLYKLSGKDFAEIRSALAYCKGDSVFQLISFNLKYRMSNCWRRRSQA